MTKPTVLIADDHRTVADGIARCLRETFEVIGIVTVLEQIEPETRRSAPEILVLDLVFGQKSAMRVIPLIRKASDTTRIVVLTAHHTVSLADAAIVAGAHAFVLKTGTTEDLVQGISHAMGGDSYISPLVYSLQPEPVPAALKVTLSEIEISILDALLGGCTQEEAAVRVNRTPKDVEYHLRKLRIPLGFTRTAELLGWYQRWLRAT